MGAINVIIAVYASKIGGADVTQACQRIVDTGNDDIAVNNNTFGDPSPLNQKFFTISYTINNGPLLYKGCQEGDVIDLV
jgi:hypothetical protein